MQTLRELNSISTFTPVHGILLQMYELVLDNAVNKQQAIKLFRSKQRKDGFYLPYKRLKDKLLQGILENSFSELTAVQQQHIQLIKNFAETKILILLDKKTAGVKIAEEVIKKAEKLGNLDMVLALSRDMQMHYSVTEPSKDKFNFFNEKVKVISKYYQEEIEMQTLFAEMVFCYRKKKNLMSFFPALNKQEKIANQNNNFRFLLCYYYAKNIEYDYKKQDDAFIKNTKEALELFDKVEIPLPYTVRWNFLINLVPIYLKKADHTQTERTLNACLSLPTKGSFNWHLTLLYKALYGFNTNKPYIALTAWQTAHSIPKKFESPIITERWQMVEAYLAFYGKIGRIEYPKTFRLYRFLNTIQRNRADNPQKANLLVLEFIHLFVDGKYKQYTEKTFGLDQKIAKNFNQQTFRRTKYFLRSLKGILKGNFHPVGALRHSKSHLDKMHSFANDLDLNVLDREVVPYEFLWEELHAILEQKRDQRKRLV